ncbi:MAG TPA: MG2 domain-containing protein [Bacteroidales bacterium]|nr:MG2 domain-containing protein [Bacteroidales bacterium]
MKLLSSLLSTAFVLLMLLSCKHGATPFQMSDPADYDKIIVGHTAGIISSQSAVQVTFAKAIESYQPGAELPADVFTFVPSISGTATVEDSYSISFKPNKPLKQGIKYAVSLNLVRLMEVPKELKKFNFGFEVITQDFTVLEGHLMPESIDIADKYLYKGIIITADLMSVEEVEKLFKASAQNKDLNIQIESEGIKKFSYTIRDIERLDIGSKVTLSWNGDKIGLKKRGDLDIAIPGKNEFILLSHEVNHENKSLQLIFSDPIDNKQEIAGLIGFQSTDDVRISRYGAIVTLFPNQTLIDEQVVKISEWLRSAGGITLGKPITLFVQMDALKPQVEIIGNGNIIPDSKNLFLHFKAVGLKAVDVAVYKIFANNIKQYFQEFTLENSGELRYVGRPVFIETVRLDKDDKTDLNRWNAFSVDLTEMVRKDTEAIYHVKISFKRNYSLFDCNNELTDDNEIEQAVITEEEVDYFDGKSYWYYYWPENYNWYEQDDPCSDSYYINDRFPTRNIMASNIGILTKSVDNLKFSVAITDLLTTKPIDGSLVEFFNFQQQKIGEVSTSASGMAEIELTSSPYLISASYQNQKSWLKVDNGSSLSLSNFDVSGKEIQKGIKGFIYEERGVWRPGDTLFITFLMDDRLQKLPNNHPVLFELFDSRGNLYKKQIKTEGVDNFYTFITPTKPDAPTGKWLIKISVGGATFEKRINIENVKPNRLKMDIRFDDKVLTTNSLHKPGFLKSSWLHGTAASNLKATVNLKLCPIQYTFKGHDKYQFTDPTKTFNPIENIIFDAPLDSNGEAPISLQSMSNIHSPGMLNAVFTSRVFEYGGDFSTDIFEIPFSPFDVYTGINITGADGIEDVLETDKDIAVEVVTIDHKGNAVSQDNLELNIYKLSWRWWWSSTNDNIASWVNGQGTELIEHKTFYTTQGKARQHFKIEYPEWGQYFVQVVNTNNRHSTGKIVFVDWPNSFNRSGRKHPAAATMLSFTTDKEKYTTGENATVTFPSTEGANAMISLETSSGILKQWWQECKKDKTSFDIRITPEMTPNFFVSITLIQPHGSTVNDLPIRLYGVIPVMVEEPQTRLTPEISVEKEIRPETPFTIKVSEKSGKAMTYTLAIVDEGLLGLTRFKTPDPWSSFFAREALGVKTWDMFDQVMGAYGGELQKVLAIGGDDELARAGEKKANRFKPVVIFSGPFTLKAGKQGLHQFTIPNYTGEVRIMVIAGKNGSWGASEKNVNVKQPIMLLPTLPRKLSPDEEVIMPVSVFSMSNKVKKVAVKIKTDGHLIPLGNTYQEADFSDIGEKMVYFSLKADGSEGYSSVSLEATSGSEKATASVEIEVKHPNPYTTISESHIIQEGAQQKIDITPHGLPQTNSVKLNISSLPSFEIEKSLQFLINYPYGCLEQIVSSSFAQLYLSDLIELSDNQKVTTDRNIRATLKALTGYNKGGGRLSYWPGSATSSTWSEVYAGHFMFLAEQKGYSLPANLKSSWLEAQSRLAMQYNSAAEQENKHDINTQAYRLYVLALAGKPVFSAMNRLNETNNITKEAAWRLAAAYYLAGRPETAEKLIKQTDKLQTTEHYFMDENFGSSLRDQAMIVETMTLMNKKQEAFNQLNRMARQYNAENASTQTAAFCLYALSRYAKLTGSEANLNFDLTVNNKKESLNSTSPVYEKDLGKFDNPSSITIQNKGKGDLITTISVTGQSPYSTEQTTASNLRMQTRFLSTDGRLINVGSIKQGDDFTAEISITHPGTGGDYKNMALNFAVPSGWEILNRRFQNTEVVVMESKYTFRDIRDDRVDTFFDLPAGKTVIYRIELNASYEGKYYMPAVKCEAMYERSIYAIEKGKWIEVKK